jgi:hypothetical protein
VTSTTTTIGAGLVVKVAGTIEVEVRIQGELEKSTLEDIFRSGIAEALAVPVDNVVNIEVTEVIPDQGVRRLQAVQTKRFEVSYELLPPASMDPDTIVEKANLISSANTAEFEVFKEALESSSSVAEVGEIISKVPAYTFQDELTSTSPQILADSGEEGSSAVPLVVGGVAGFFVLILLAGAVLFYKRRNAGDGSREALRIAAAERDAEAGEIQRVPSNTLLGSSGSKNAGKDGNKKWINLD